MRLMSGMYNITVGIFTFLPYSELDFVHYAGQGNRLNKPLTRLYFLNRGVRAHLFFRRFRMSCTPNDSTAPAFLTHFQAVEDPRQEGKVLYPL